MDSRKDTSFYPEAGLLTPRRLSGFLHLLLTESLFHFCFTSCILILLFTMYLTSGIFNLLDAVAQLRWIQKPRQNLDTGKEGRERVDAAERLQGIPGIPSVRGVPDASARWPVANRNKHPSMCTKSQPLTEGSLKTTNI